MHPELKNVPILIFANKSDLKGAKGTDVITDSFKLHDIKDHEWHLQE